MSGRVEATEGEGGGRPVARGLAEIPGLYGVESGGPGRGNTKEIHLITQMRGMIGCRRSDLRKRGKSRFRLPIKKPHFLARVMGKPCRRGKPMAECGTTLRIFDRLYGCV